MEVADKNKLSPAAKWKKNKGTETIDQYEIPIKYLLGHWGLIERSHIIISTKCYV